VQEKSKTGHLTETIQQELKRFRVASLTHVYRDLNFAVHALAKEAAHKRMGCIWLEDAPRSISSVVIGEQCGP
jgi:hypothetical protein